MSGTQIALEVKGTGVDVPVPKRKQSAFTANGMAQEVEARKAEIKALYLEGETPFVVGWSGGKDSTATLQLVWSALQELDPEDLTNPVHVISTDTLVENPVIAAYVAQALEKMNAAAKEQGLPIEGHRLTPKLEDRFFSMLIGRGYASPRPKFRWCTERLKIRPSNEFITRVVQSAGEVILVLGTRKAESTARARTMERHEKGRVRDRLSPNASLPNSAVYSPIEDWSDDDVWIYLMQAGRVNPFGLDNHDLLTLYQGATEDGECPLVVDSTTPSCGDSRFGCWTCTLVNQDKSMSAMIQNDEAREWMMPLLEIRNALDATDPETGLRDDYDKRDFRRMNGRLHLFHPTEPSEGDEQRETLVHGPYLQSAREEWLRLVLTAQMKVRESGPDYVRNIELLPLDELDFIRNQWVEFFGEFEDTLPGIYEEIVGEPYPGKSRDDHMALGSEEVALLREICGDDVEHFRMVRELLSIERTHRSKVRRAGLFEELEQAIVKGSFDNEEDALAHALAKRKRLSEATGRKADTTEGGQLPLDVATVA